MSRDNPVEMYKKELPSVKELKERMPLSDRGFHFVEQAKREIVSILEGEVAKTLLIVGPCSIHDTASAKEYALRLKELSVSIGDTFMPVMRVYFAKPRTRTGWKGLLYDPHLNGSCDIERGLVLTRQLLLDLVELQLPAAAEILDPLTAHYFSDLISWGCIGARTAASQIHREIASSLSMPIAFKNNTDGNCQVAIDGAFSASFPHDFVGVNEEGRLSVISSRGNPHCHIVLRGGLKRTNYDPLSVAEAAERQRAVGVAKKLIIDCSHDNSNQDHREQSRVFQSVIEQVVDGCGNIGGLILESNLLEGNQEVVGNRSSIVYGRSITDACLDWDSTEELVQWGRMRVKSGHAEIDSALPSPLHATK